MRRVIIILLCCLLAGGCSALPAEERSFAVALGLSVREGVWEAAARIPSYQQSGGYLTLQARGGSLEEAMAGLDASAPMRMHYGQLRLLIFSGELARSGSFVSAVEAVADRAETRLQAQLCVTEDPMKGVMDALEPQTGARLSKSLDVMLETRREMGVIPDASLSGILRMGQRQDPVLIRISLEDEKTLRLTGGEMISGAAGAQGSLSAEEMQLLSLMQGKVRRTMITLEDGTVTIHDAGCRLSLDGNRACVRLKVRCSGSSLTAEGAADALQREVRGVIGRLAEAGCEALGLGRFAIRHFRDAAAWRELDWRHVYPALEWEILVDVQTAAQA